MNKRAEIRNKIISIGITDDIFVKSPDEYQFFYDLLKTHPNANTKLDNMKTIGIRTNPTFKQLELFILYNDGTRDSISYNKCLGVKRNHLLQAARQAIVNQILLAKDNLGDECEICKSQVKLQVDHVIKFECIFDEFKKSMHYIPTEFKSLDDGRHEFIDEEYKITWCSYHEDRAKYRLLCQKCNNKAEEVFRKNVV